MSNVIDEKVVEMSFDNRNFEKNVHESMETLKKLKDSLEFKGAEKGFESLQNASRKISFSNLSNEIEKATSSFGDFLNVVGNVHLIRRAEEALTSLENKVISFTKSMTIDQVSAGWGKYEQKVQAVQTIMSATHKPIEEVEEGLEKLIWFSDETSYSFTDMVTSIGKFTSAGVDLNTSVNAVMGISTWAARSGQDINEAGRAMYNMAQALSTGVVKLIDWKSIENANMATTEFKQAAMDAAVAMGTLRKEGDKYVTTAKGTVVTTEKFNDSLKDEWFTSKVLLSVLSRYGGYASDLYQFIQDSGDASMTASEAMEIYTGEVDELGKGSLLAAQEAKSLTDAINATKDAVSSGWMNIWETIFGNYEEAKKGWTEVSNALWDVFAGGFEGFADYLSGAFDMNGRSLIEDAVEAAEINSHAFYTAVGQVLMQQQGLDIADLEAQWGTLENFALSNEALHTPEVFAEALGLITDSLDLQNGSVQDVAVNWRALQRQITEVGGSVEDFEDAAKFALRQSGVDVDALIEQYGSFDKAVTEGKILSPEIIGEAFRGLATGAEDYVKTMPGGKVTLKEFDQLFGEVWNGKYGVGIDRQKALTEAGYDYAKVQELINKRAAGIVITEEDLVGIRSQEVVRVEGLADAYTTLGETYEFAGKNAWELSEDILDSGNSLNYFSQNLDGLTGRELLFDGIVTFLNQINDVIEAIRAPWNDIFMSNPAGLLKTLAVLNTFIHSFDLGEEEISDLSDAFGGLFSILNIFKETIGTILALMSPLFNKMGDGFKTIIRISGSIGRVVALLSDLLLSDIYNFLYSLPGKISEGFGKLGGYIDRLYQKFTKLFEKEDGSNKFIETIEKIRKGFDYLKRKFEDIKKVLKSVFNPEDFLDPVSKQVGLFNKLKEAFGKIKPILKDIKARFEKEFGPAIRKVEEIVGFLTQKFQIVKTAIQPAIDAVKNFFDEGFSDRISGTIETVRTKFESIKKTITDAIDTVKRFFGFGDEKQNTPIKVGLETDQSGRRRPDDKMAELIEKLTGGDQKLNIFQKIGASFSILKDILSDLIHKNPILGKIFDTISEKVRAFGDAIRQSKAYQKVKEIFETKVSPAFLKAFDFLKEKFTSLKNAVEHSSAFQKIKEFFETRIKNNISNILTSLKDKFLEIKQKIVDSGFFKSIQNFFTVKYDKNNLPDWIGKIVEKIKALGNVLKGENPFQKIGDYFKKKLFGDENGAVGIVGVLNSIKERIAGILSWISKNWSTFVTGIIATGSILIQSGMIKKIIEIVQSIRKSSEDAGGFKLNGILQLAIAVGIIAGTVYLISKLDTQSAIKGAIGVGLIIVALVSAFKILQNGDKSIGSGDTSIANLGKSVLQLSGVIAILSQLKFGDVIKGAIGLFAVMSILVLFFNWMSSSASNVSTGKDVAKEMSEAMTRMAGVVVLLGGMDFLKMLQGVFGLALVVGILSAFFTALNEIKTQVTIGAAVITAIGASLIALSGAVLIIGNMEFTKAAQGVLGVLVLSAALSVVFIALSTMTGQIALGAAAIAAIGFVIRMLADVVKDLANVENIQNGFLALVELIGSFTAIALLMAGFTYIAIPALAGIVLFGVFAVSLREALRIVGTTLAASDITFAIHSISGFFITLSSLFGQLANMMPAMVTAASGFALIGILMPAMIYGISGLSAIITALALLNEIPGFTEFVESGGSVLILFSKILARALGTFIAEFASAATSKLPEIGKNLTEFIVNLLPFIAGMQLVSSMNMENAVKKLVKCLIVLAGADLGEFVLQRLTGRSPLEALGKELEVFGKSFRSFLVAIGGLQDETKDADKKASIDTDKISSVLEVVPRLVELTHMDFSGTGLVSGLFSGNLFTFSLSIKEFGVSFAQFADALVGSGLTLENGKEIEPLDANKITLLEAAVGVMDRLSKITPPGLPPDWLKGTVTDNSLAAWGKDLATFGPCFAKFADGISKCGLTETVDEETGNKIQKLDEDKITALQTVIPMIEKLSGITSPTGLPPAWLKGAVEDNSLAAWGADLATFGPCFTKFAEGIAGCGLTESVNEETGNKIQKLDEDKITALQTIIPMIEKLSKITSPVGTPPDWLKGAVEDNSLAAWGKDLETFGPSFIKFVDGIAGCGLTESTDEETGNTIQKLDEDKIAALESIIPMIERLSLVETPGQPPQWLKMIQGDNSLKAWGDDLADFAEPFRTFCDAVNGSGLTTGSEVTLDEMSETKTTNLETAIGILERLSKIEVPETGFRIPYLWTGNQTYGSLGEQLRQLGPDLAFFIKSASQFSMELEDGNVEEITLTDDDFKNAESAFNLLEKLTGLSIPTSVDGFSSIFEFGGTDGNAIGRQIAALGNGLGAFCNALQGNTSNFFDTVTLDDKKVSCAEAAIQLMEKILGLKMPTEASWINKIFDDSTISLDDFGKGLENLGKGLHSLIMAANGFTEDTEGVKTVEFSEDDINRVMNLIPLVQKLASIRFVSVSISDWTDFKTMVGQIAESMPGFVNSFKDFYAVNDISEETISTAKTVLSIIAILSEISDNIYYEGYEKFGEFGEATQNLVEPIKSFIIGINDALNDKSIQVNKTSIENVLSIIPMIASISSASLEHAENEIDTAIEDLFTQIGLGIPKVVNAINSETLDATKKAAFESLINYITTIDETPFKTFVTNFTTDYGNFTGLFNGASDSFYTIGTDIAKGLANGITQGTTDYVVPAAAAMAVAAGYATADEAEVQSPSKVFQKLGRFVSEGFGLGIQNGVGDVVNAAEDLGKSAIEGTRDALDCHSPSREMEEVGEDYDEGEAIGIESNAGVVVDAAEDVADQATGALAEADPSSAGEEFADKITDMLFGDLKGEAEKGAEDLEEGTAAVIDSVLKGDQKAVKKAAKEVVEDDAASAVDSAANGMKDRESTMTQTASDLVKKLGEQIISHANEFFTAGQELGKKFNEGLADGFGRQEGGGSASTTGEGGIGEVNAVEGLAAQMFKAFAIIDKLTSGDEAERRLEAFKTLITGLANSLNTVEIDEEKADLITSIANSLSDAAQGLSGAEGATFADFVSQIATAMTDSKEDMDNAAKVLVDEIVGYFSENYQLFTDIGKKIVILITQGIQQNVPFIRQAAAQLAANVQEVFSTHMSGPKAKEAGTKFVSSFSEGVTESLDQVGHAFESLNEKGIDVTSFTESAVEGLQTAAGEISVPASQIGSILRAMVPDGAGMVTSMCEGMIEGFTGPAAEAAIEAALWFAAQMKGALRGAFKINSPSKFTKWLGEGLVEGLVLGLEEATPQGVTAMETFADQVLDSWGERDLKNDGLKETADIIKAISTFIQNDDFGDPVISPVLDLSDVEDKGRLIPGMLERSFGHANQINMAMEDRYNQMSSNSLGDPYSGQTIQFTQNNYSPKSLSASEIYRQTKNVLGQYRYS